MPHQAAPQPQPPDTAQHKGIVAIARARDKVSFVVSGVSALFASAPAVDWDIAGATLTVSPRRQGERTVQGVVLDGIDAASLALVRAGLAVWCVLNPDNEVCARFNLLPNSPART